jgi:hypothetical protein
MSYLGWQVKSLLWDPRRRHSSGHHHLPSTVPGSAMGEESYKTELEAVVVAKILHLEAAVASPIGGGGDHVGGCLALGDPPHGTMGG